MQQIKILDNEKWWGGKVELGYKMPYDQNTIATINLYNESSPNESSANELMPLLLSNKGRIIWCEDGFSCKFDKGIIEVSSHGEIVLEDTKGNLQTAYTNSEKYTKPTQELLPESVYSVAQFNSWIELIYDQSETGILTYAQSIIDNGYTPGILMIDDNWQEDYGVWEFSAKRFQNPKQMMQKLNAMGFEIMLWVCPFVSPDSQVFRYLRDNDCFIKDKNGNVAIREWWNGYSAVLDLTNPKAHQWFKGTLDNLVDEYGVKGFKFDAGGGYSYLDDDICFENVNTLDQIRIYSEFCALYPYNELRTGYKTANLRLAQRLCDKEHKWFDNGIESLIPNGLLQNMLGYKYNCPDMIGCGEYRHFLEVNDSLDQELFVRYAQIAALFPIMQFSASPFRVLSEENNRYCFEAAEIHRKFGDYIIKQAKLANENKMPLMMHMAIAYPDNGYENVDTQFMLGTDLLVAPSTKQNERSKTVFIPQGEWIGDDATEISGPCEITIDVPLSRLPYYKKK